MIRLVDMIERLRLWEECWRGRANDGKLTLDKDEALSIAGDYARLRRELDILRNSLLNVAS